MISHKYKCIFIHNRKCAGSTVANMFYEAGDTKVDTSSLEDGILDPKWQTTQAVNNYFKFVIVRNPWDRLVSSWKYLHSTKQQELNVVLEHLPQNHLINNVLDKSAPFSIRLSYAKHMLKEFLIGKGHYLPGHEYRHITRAQHETFIYSGTKLVVDEVVYFEDLSNGLRSVFDQLGVLMPSVPHINKGDGRNRNYKLYFDDITRDLCGEIFYNDISLWGYDFHSGLPNALKS